jgi:hypothetical protein
MIDIKKDCSFFPHLKNIITDNILNVSDSKIDEYYKYWNQNLYELKTNFLKISGDLIHNKQLVPKDSILKGIDLPTWFGNPKNKRIVILGIDPLRNHKVFKQAGADVKNDVILGTPYAFHEKLSREKNCKSYWTLAEGLVNTNNFVYCTDIFKTYFHREIGRVRSYRDPDYIKNENHLIILKEELNLIQPDIIIVFGQLAHSFLLKKKCQTIGQSIVKTKSIYELNERPIDVYTVLHLSKTPRGNNFKKFFENNGMDTLAIDVENRVQCAVKYLEIFKQNKII